MTDQYQKAVEKVLEGDNEFIDFHARRLVEMAAHIIMSYLLLSDAQSDDSYAMSAEIYTGKSKSWNDERYSYIKDFSACQLNPFLSVKGENVGEA